MDYAESSQPMALNSDHCDLFMPAIESPKIPASSDAQVKRPVTIVPAVCLAALYGCIACLDRRNDGLFHFHWHWLALLWIIIGACSSMYFCHKMWPPPRYPAATRKGVIKGLIVLIVPALWWLAFALRFLIGGHFWDAVTPFIAVAMALSYGAWMVTRLLKLFESSDEYDLNALKLEEEQNARTDSVDKSI